MTIPRVDAVLEECERHLDSSQSHGTQVEAILTAYASAVIYSAFEARARAIVTARGVGQGEDPDLGSFCKYAATRLLRSIKIGELAGAAAWFHSECKDRFHDTLEPEAKAAWDSIVSNRHGVAHEDDAPTAQVISNLTFGELKRLYPLALTVLDALEAAIAPRRAPSADEVGTGLGARLDAG
ncbi:hypothetical protein ABZ949_21490 [Micromonospora tulbaghiae]|uniref:hypothetical protein n=1 Tax=Micromonospora tulbaghiae TaxID=479978 RepID=UPI0033CA59F8